MADGYKGPHPILGISKVQTVGFLSPNSMFMAMIPTTPSGYADHPDSLPTFAKINGITDDTIASINE